MSRPVRYLVWMLVFLLLAGGAAAILHQELLAAFRANPVLNGMILGVLLFGLLYSLWQVVALNREIDFVEQLQRESSGGLIFPGTISELPDTRLLGPMANMLREKRGRLTLSAVSMRTLHSGIQIRIDEIHDISRYVIGLLIFLGLLGTFWGLLETVRSVSDAVGTLGSETGSDSATLFAEFIRGLERPIAGMGTAFSSSLFGLAGSLIVGFLELQSTQAHNRFLNQLEEWLSSMTKLSGGVGAGGEGEASVPAYVQALLEQTADSLDNLQRTIARGEEDRMVVNNNLAVLTDRLTTLTDQMRTEQQVMRHLAETQIQMKSLLARLSEDSLGPQGASEVLDEATRDHIRSMHLNIAKIAGELQSGRDQAVEQIRSEIRLLARTIAALAEESNG